MPRLCAVTRAVLRAQNRPPNSEGPRSDVTARLPDDGIALPVAGDPAYGIGTVTDHAEVLPSSNPSRKTTARDR
jgi:hypothetical protein